MPNLCDSINRSFSSKQLRINFLNPTNPPRTSEKEETCGLRARRCADESACVRNFSQSLERDSHRLSAFKHETAAFSCMKPSTKHADNAMNWSNCGPFIVDAFQCRVYDTITMTLSMHWLMSLLTDKVTINY